MKFITPVLILGENYYIINIDSDYDAELDTITKYNYVGRFSIDSANPFLLFKSELDDSNGIGDLQVPYDDAYPDMFVQGFVIGRTKSHVFDKIKNMSFLDKMNSKKYIGFYNVHKHNHPEWFI